MINDFGHEYAPHVPRRPTEQLIELLREHHPERETTQGWRQRSAETTLPEPVDEAEVEPASPALSIATPRGGWVGALLRDVAADHGLTLADLRSRSRRRRIVHARQAVMAVLRERGYSTSEIGRRLGGFDHTTVLHGLRAHQARQSQP